VVAEGEEVELSPHRPRVRGALLWLALVIPFGLLLFAYHYLEVVASRGSRPMMEPFITELTGAIVGGVLFFPARRLVRRLPLTRSNLARRLPLYVLAVLVLGPLATTLMWGARSILYPLAGLGSYDYGVMPMRYFMELPLQVIWLTGVFAAVHVYDALEAARVRELRAAQLEGSLARAQLRNLRLQLQPHFLFNALNTISATMYEDPAAADEMLDQLAELLRASLRTAQSDEVPLGEELALLDRYLALLHARFGSRLEVDLQLDPEAAGALVPSLFLQPLVENAIRHGNAEREGRGAVAVRARREGETLILEVEDDGPGDQGTADRTPARREPGLGLAATAERLKLLYGEAQTFSAGHGEHGGFLVRACLPFRTAEGATA
jgi:two-component system LytT family sensor kinase